MYKLKGASIGHPNPLVTCLIWFVHQSFYCTPTDDRASATTPPTTSPTTQPTTKAPTTKPSKIYFVIYHWFILYSYVLATKPMSVRVKFELGRYMIQESCTLLPVTLVVKGKVLRPFTIEVKLTGLYPKSAEGMQQN